MRITSDGTPIGTKVFNEDGTEIKGIVSLNISADHSGVFAAVRLFFTEIELVGVRTSITGPRGPNLAIAKIVYADGTVDDYAQPLKEMKSDDEITGS